MVTSFFFFVFLGVSIMWRQVFLPWNLASLVDMDLLLAIPRQTSLKLMPPLPSTSMISNNLLAQGFPSRTNTVWENFRNYFTMIKLFSFLPFCFTGLKPTCMDIYIHIYSHVCTHTINTHSMLYICMYVCVHACIDGCIYHQIDPSTRVRSNLQE